MKPRKSREELPNWNSRDLAFPAATTIMTPAARLGFDGSLQCGSRTAFLRPAIPGVVSDIRSFGRIPSPDAAYRVRGKEKFHVLDASGRCNQVGNWSILRHAIHFAPGVIPIWLPAPSSPIAMPMV